MKIQEINIEEEKNLEKHNFKKISGYICLGGPPITTFYNWYFSRYPY